MAIADCGTTRFDYEDGWTGKVRVQTVEGSSIAIPCEDILKFVSLYARELQAIKLSQMDWREVLGKK